MPSAVCSRQGYQLRFRVRGLGVKGLGVRVWSLGFKVLDVALGFGDSGLRFGV